MPKVRTPAEQKQHEKQMAYLTVGGVGLLLVIVGAIVAYTFMTAEKTLLKPETEPDPIDKNAKPVELAPVTLAPRPIRLFDEYIKAIARNDRKEVVKLSNLSEQKLDLLMAEDRVAVMKESLASKRFEIAPEKIEGQKARMSAIFSNGKGQQMMELALLMEQRLGPEDWHVVEVEDRWFASSGKMPESRTVPLGGDRTAAAAPLMPNVSFKSMPEADPVELEWVPGTTEAQKAEIEKHIRELFDDVHPQRATAAAQSLLQMGKITIPRLLNELGKLDIRKEDDNKHANLIDRTLAAMTDLEMGYDTVGLEGAAMPPAQARTRAVRRWFGWWLAHKNEPLPERPK